MAIAMATAVRRRRSGGKVASRPPLSRTRRIVLGVIGIVGFLAFWEIAVSGGWVDPIFASSPLRIWDKAVQLTELGVLWPAVLSTARLFGLGFGISLVLGLTLGIVLGWYRNAKALLDPWVSILYAAPRIAFIPLIVVWAGIGMGAQIVVVVINAVFPILINTAAGVDAIDRQHLRVAQSFGAGNGAVLRTVALPGAMPIIIAGVRNGMMIALLGTVVAEYFVGLTGLGGLIFNAGLTLDTSAAFVGAVILSLAALILSSILNALQARVDRWR
jgi:ABC-type nitrate/sulfonate/bicarbonate transport system permease component